MKTLAAFVAGLLFGLGLIVSGMTDPAKVQTFLDLAGHWDPSLALVMAAAVAIAFPAFRTVRRHARSLLGAPVALPPTSPVDARLLAGSALFGAGWGLAGFCPGPAVVALFIDPRGVGAFMLGMLLGMIGFEAFERWSRRRAKGAGDPAAARRPQPSGRPMP